MAPLATAVYMKSKAMAEFLAKGCAGLEADDAVRELWPRFPARPSEADGALVDVTQPSPGQLKPTYGTAQSTLKKQFARLDVDGNGSLERSELRELMQTLDSELWTDENVDLLFDSMDANKDNQIQFNEFVDWVFANTDEGSGRVFFQPDDEAALEAKKGATVEPQKDLVADLEMAAVPEWYPEGNPYVHKGKDVLKFRQHKGLPNSAGVFFTDGSKEEVEYGVAEQLIEKWGFVIHETGKYLYDYNGGRTEATYESVPKEDTDKWETDSGDLPARLPSEYRVKQ